ncbi:MAG TPA: dTDP-4-dehydrorhamnose reductase [Terracidiphilus sp.]|nr:dTDP-4-dehydrorhamnose reductase [Terracidiphilus sp.]
MSEPRRILILGAAGQVGRELQRSFAGAGELICAGRARANLAQPDQLRELIRSVRPHVLLNAAAYTAVDRAEAEPELAFAVNGEAPRVLAEEALSAGILLVHYSTDYVFDGSKQGAWEESDAPHPLNVYGASKLVGEDAIRAVGGKYLIFRTSWVYGPHGNNFLGTMLRLGRERDRLTVVDDQVGAPTTSIELADATRLAVDGALAGRYGVAENWAGLYHMTCGGSTSWYGFAQEIFARAKGLPGALQPIVEPILSSQYKTAATRPKNSVLSNQKLQSQLGIRLKPWQEALDAVFAQFE